MSYADFIASKLQLAQPVGINVPYRNDIKLMPHQDALVRWALRRGRAAIFADTGLGKSRMELTWADTVHRHTGGDVLILTPLAVATQTVREGEKAGIEVHHCRDGSDVRPGINVTNYERLHKFDTDRFVAVVLGESSCIKHHETKTLADLLDRFSRTPYRLCETATPSPNDWTELGTHAEFLGICTRQEMLAEYFVHDAAETQVWRLKGHARQQFWRFVSSWGAMIRKPSDLGFDDAAYILPPLNVQEHIVASCMETANTQGFLFPVEAGSMSERRDARRQTIEARVKACADAVNASDESWVIWCDLNAEGDALRQAIPGAVEIRGSDDPDAKEQHLVDFSEGRIRRLITKPSIAGHGLNWQHCSHTAFVGVTDSYESYYQAVRRFYRFGQQRQVNVHLFASEAEGSVLANLRRKESDAMVMAEQLSAETHDAVMAEVMGTARRTNTYNARQAANLPAWLQSEAA